jgi:ELWxxDGT repeat protein
MVRIWYAIFIPGTNDDGVSSLFIVFDSALYFEARDVAYGSELWRSDGTTAGTYLFWDACPGSCSGTTYGNFPPEFASFNNLLFLRASATGIGTELFSTNGDSANVSLVKDINPGSFSGSPGRFHVWNNHFYFSASDLGSAREIWVSDGTAGGTQLLKDINPGGFSAGDPEHLTPAKNGLFFSAVSPNIGRELWKTDGTPGGTVLVKDINPGSANGISTSEFQAVGDYVVFIANDGTTGTESLVVRWY